jgi:hypothetical protein
MKRAMSLSIWFGVAALSWAGTVPNQITYQGTIKEQGVPVTGTRTMVFRFTDKTGGTQYGPSISSDVVVNQGLFAIDLSPTGVDWQNVTPYIVLAVAPQGQTPTPSQQFPPQAIAATAYSLMSGTVVDGSITLSKLDSGVSNYLIPAGMVALFTTPTCPAGWSEVTALRGRTAFGYDSDNPGLFTLGQQGGSLTHTHTFTTLNDGIQGSHSHSGATGRTSGPGGTANSFSAGHSDFPLYGDTYPISLGGGAHVHTGQTDPIDPTYTLPRYTTMLFCSKL